MLRDVLSLDWIYMFEVINSSANDGEHQQQQHPAIDQRDANERAAAITIIRESAHNYSNAAATREANAV